MSRFEVDVKNIAIVREKVIETPESIALLEETIEQVSNSGAAGNGWTDLLITTQPGRTQRAKNSDIPSYPEGSFPAGVSVFLPQQVINVTSQPKNLWGLGLTKQVNKVSAPIHIPYPLQGTHIHAVDVDKNHKGLNSHPFVNSTTGELTVVYRTATYHGVCVSEFISRTSNDNGQTWSNPTSVYSATGLDTRCSVSIQEGSLCIINLITRNPADLTYGDAKSLVSNDYGQTWTVYNIANPTGRAINFHGNLVRFGSKIIGYSYANAGNIDAYWTEDNGQTWTFVAAAIAKNVAIPSLSECTVVKVGSVGVAIIRTGNEFSGVSVNNSGDGLSWSSPVRSTMPMGTNPYSGIIDGDVAWVLFCDRKQNSGIVQDRGVLFALKIDQAFINSNYTNFGFYEVCQTPFYSVTHPFGFKDLNGRWCATFNGGEQDGTSAALYVMNYSKPVALSKTAVLDAIKQPNLLVDGGFNLTRIFLLNEEYSGNFRNKYFTDGWAFGHSSSGTVKFQIVPVMQNGLNSPLIKSRNFLRIDCEANQSDGSIFISNRLVLGSLGFRGALTVSFYARTHSDTTVPATLSASTQRYYKEQAFSDTRAAVTGIVLTPFWKKFTGTVYFENTKTATVADTLNGFDALNLSIIPNASGDIRVDIADVKLEHGERATEFDSDLSQILQQANEYYYPSAQPLTGTNGAIRRRHYVSGTFSDVIEFRQTMKKVPKLLVYSTSGLAGRVFSSTSGGDVGVATVNITAERALIETGDSIAGGANVSYHYSLDARPTT